MNVKELKDYLDSLPEEFEKFNMVNGEYCNLAEEGEEERLVYRVDDPIQLISIDEENKEIIFCHQTQEEIDKIRT